MIHALFMPPEADWQETINANVKMHAQVHVAQSAHNSMGTSQTSQNNGINSLNNGANSLHNNHNITTNTTTTTNQPTMDPTYMLLAQTWDVLESPLFAAALTESIDTCFKSVFGMIKQSCFLKDQDFGHGPVSTLHPSRLPHLLHYPLVNYPLLLILVL